MIKIFISKLIYKRKNFRLRLIYKGYKILKKDNRLGLLIQLKDLLANTQLKNVHFPKHLLHGNRIDAELSARQYLTEKILGLAFNKSILYSIGTNNPLRCPLPREFGNCV